MTYTAARMSFLKTSQTTLTQETPKDPPIILAEKFLISGPDHITAPRMVHNMRRAKGRVDFYIGNFLTENSRLIAFKIGKKKLRPLGIHSKRTFKNIEQEHFPSSTVLWSADTQIILIEKPKKDQMRVKSIINNLQSYLSSLLIAYGFTVIIEPLTYKSTFWDVIDKYDRIYSVEFTLTAPNFLGLSEGAKELVSNTKENYNADRTSLKLASEEGNLQIRKGNSLVESLLSWIVPGAGRWVAYVGLNAKKIPIRSESAPKTLNEELPKYDAEIAKEFTSKAVDSIDEKQKPKED